MGLAEGIVLVSIVLQFVAAALAIRMIGVTGRRRAWLFVAAAVTLMGVRRAFSFYASVTGESVRPLDLGAESIALAISILMVLGMYYLKPVFEEAIATRLRADTLHHRMGALSSLMSDAVVQFRLPAPAPARAAGAVRAAPFEILEANPAFESLSETSTGDVHPTTAGPSPAGARTLSSALDLSEDDEARLTAGIGRMLSDRTGGRETHLSLRSRGRWLGCSFYLLDSEVGVGILRDRTEEQAHNESLEALVRERTEELERANTELRESNDVKSRFLAAMSHELRTPLNSVIGFSGVLLSGAAGPLNAEQSRQLAMVRASGKRLLALVNDILDLSKIDAGAVRLDLSPADLNGVAAEALEFVRPEADGAGIRLRFIPHEGDPHRCSAFVVDREKLQQILLNLLSNAVKYTSQGEVAVAVACDGAGGARVSVADTGRGIPAEDLDRIFGEFEQVEHPGEAKPAGSGLGLPISRQLARLMGGDITVSSRPGEGSTFTVELPGHGMTEREGT